MTAQGEIDLDAIEQAVEARFADVAPLKRHQGYPGDISAIVDAPLTIRQARALVALARQAQQPAGGVAMDAVTEAFNAADDLMEWLWAKYNGFACDEAQGLYERVEAARAAIAGPRQVEPLTGHTKAAEHHVADLRQQLLNADRCIGSLLATLTKLTAIAADVVAEVDALMADSEGVAGLHKNGDLAPWHELKADGQYPWLGSVETLREALASYASGNRPPAQPAGGLDGVIAAIRAAGWNIRLQCSDDVGCSVDLGRIAITDRDGGLITILGPTPLAALTAAAKAAGILIPPRAANKPAPEAWIIVYDDSDEENEHFVGHGATEAALKRFEGRKVAWNCHLFRCVASA